MLRWMALHVKQFGWLQTGQWNVLTLSSYKHHPWQFGVLQWKLLAAWLSAVARLRFKNLLKSSSDRSWKKVWKKLKFLEDFVLVRAHHSGKNFIRHLHISHNAPYLPPKILHNLCFSCLLGITAVQEKTMLMQNLGVVGVRGGQIRCIVGDVQGANEI